MISQTVEYALRAVVLLARAAPAALTTAEIAEVTQIPPAYLVKVMQNLRRAGILSSRRGARGGMSLAVLPEELSLLRVVNALEPVARIRTCPLGIKSHGTNLCALHARLDAAMQTVEEAFAATTMADILVEQGAGKNVSNPLCSIPPRARNKRST